MKAKRTDDNHLQMMNFFRTLGYSVRTTHTIGQGFPDLVVGKYGMNFIIEIKDGKKPKSQQKLTPDEKDFRDAWQGQYTVLNSIDELIEFDKNIQKSLYA